MRYSAPLGGRWRPQEPKTRPPAECGVPNHLECARSRRLLRGAPALARHPAVAAQNLIKSSLVSVTLRDTSGAVVMCTATNCSM